MDDQVFLFPLEDYDRSGTMEERFYAFHEANPHVFEALFRLARAARRDGWKVTSINLFFERLRWDWAVRTKGEDYKLNNNYRAFYARAIMKTDPALNGLFRTREQKEEFEPDMERIRAAIRNGGV